MQCQLDTDDTDASNVARRRETQSTNETSAHVGKDITVEVGHHHDTIGVRCGILSYVQADAVQEVFIVCNFREVLGHLSAGRQEHAVGHLPVYGCQRRFTS